MNEFAFDAVGPGRHLSVCEEGSNIIGLSFRIINEVALIR